MRQEWDKMHFFLEQVISIPAHYVSQIIIDAYKKYGCCDFCLANINDLDFCWFAWFEVKIQPCLNMRRTHERNKNSSTLPVRFSHKVEHFAFIYTFKQ